jgi:hypothetical protein
MGTNYYFRKPLTNHCIGHGLGTYDYIAGDFS